MRLIVTDWCLQFGLQKSWVTFSLVYQAQSQRVTSHTLGTIQPWLLALLLHLPPGPCSVLSPTCFNFRMYRKHASSPNDLLWTIFKQTERSYQLSGRSSRFTTCLFPQPSSSPPLRVFVIFAPAFFLGGRWFCLIVWDYRRPTEDFVHRSPALLQ